ncbi:uncharacterized protein B0H18DRAFT_882796 [Fomitopsis serialis]|uniref:uncharacterized protein n=1 Tax=Fomitopsis serialis TaxID=139415 RepID=UPI0020089A37|nr:uncharacterized protein B0H18DRAFT_882796 [Neoantrodia serialis]KAH9918421.1 hypothetical protein B0H18DRAFT_882796 [Neoantrodia serialis]
MPRTSLWTLDVLRLANQKTQGKTSSNAYTRACQDLNVSGYVVRPFWRDLPYTDIHSCITPDVLHQLYQGVFKHIVEWCTQLVDEHELDRRIRCLPPAFGTRHFKNGISSLSQVSGTERKHMARILLACLVGKIPKKAILAFRSILDFIYIAQYTTHDDTTLQYMEDALKVFHRNKQILVDLGVRDHLNIPKFHSLLHYVDAIRLLGTTDNYNTEAFERLHIDYAKNGWRASNHRNARPQMVRWLARQEKMALSSIVDKHHAPGFVDAVAQYIYKLKDGRPLTSSLLKTAVDHMPFQRLDVFHGFKFTPESLTDDTQETDAVKAKPAKAGQAARFDTVVVLQGEDAEATGMQGTRIGRVKVIFKLPQNIRDPRTLRPLQAPPNWASQGALAYVEWYSNLPTQADPIHMMYPVHKPPLRANGNPVGEVIPLSIIRQSCQLVPRPPGSTRTDNLVVPDDWDTHTVLDKATKFWLNNWASKYAYQTLW